MRVVFASGGTVVGVPQLKDDFGVIPVKINRTQEPFLE